MKAICCFAFLFSQLVLAADFTVGVGKDETTGKKGLGFDPSVINPAQGDTIVFEFRSGAHSAVQSSFDNPCAPSAGGFNSGVQNVADTLDVDAPGLPSVRLLVNDTQPIWFFDQAGGLCKQGAVLAVNPSSTQTAAAFKENAAKSSDSPASTASSSSSQPAASSASTTATTAASPSPSKGASVKVGASGLLVVVWGVLVGFL